VRVRPLLESRLASVVPDGVAIAFDNMHRQPAADETWVRATLRPGERWQAGNLERELGTLGLDLHVPAGDGPGPAEDLAAALTLGMESERLADAGVTVQPGLMQYDAGRDEGQWFRLPLSLPYLASEEAA